MIRKHKCLFRTFVHFLLVFVSNRAGTWHLSFVTRSVETPNRGFVCCVLYCKCVGNCNGLATFLLPPSLSCSFLAKKRKLADIWTLCTVQYTKQQIVQYCCDIKRHPFANNSFFAPTISHEIKAKKRLDNYLTGVGGIARF